MTLLYRCGDEIVFELSVPTMDTLVQILEDGLYGALPVGTAKELYAFANALRSEIQHRQAERLANNEDLI